MNAAMLADGRLYSVLQHIDEDLAAEQRAGGCPRCGAALHSAVYPRKPRGVPREWALQYSERLSFCCAQRECRARATPPSVRFLGRKVYLAAVVVLIAALRCGPTPARMRMLQECVGVSRRTVMRWRAWWTETLVDTPFWRAAAGCFVPTPEHSQLPAALLERFTGEALDRLRALLRWLSPITTESAAVHVR
jgi:hypothetical protein